MKIDILFDNYFGLFVRPLNGKGCKGEENQYKICNKQVGENVSFFFFIIFYFGTIECSKSDLFFLYILYILGKLIKKQRVTIHTPILMHGVNKATPSTTNKTVIYAYNLSIFVGYYNFFFQECPSDEKDYKQTLCDQKLPNTKAYYTGWDSK